ncbi:MAG: hypothetical protein N3E45_11770 [Oscillatoriaceae bacterium SKW80]|nr:hypothetical protein [Oscillatoriaceae bacterium SKYG93]MCX8121480.1 hypothetical protein [Oscillatoriaceae bacterium SKW80]MDW8452934.1 hypothetical protein [Oscillatoriaceae cyanobacterium SKYGB_i_bin93]HIK27826.1 hypothetical protein [Oscillatoriaceae cyanobacterium M7585_C2015_266]
MTADSKDIKSVEKSSGAYLVLLILIVIGFVALAEAEKIVLPLVALAGIGWAWKRYQKQQQKKLAHLNAVFYKLIQENQGRITALDLAMKSNMPAEEVQKYLNQKMREFSAQLEVTEQGGLLYYFETALAPVFKEYNIDDSLKLSLTQIELAKRLKVHPTTVSKWKNKPEFPEWSRSKDPEARAWKYDALSKRFAPWRGEGRILNKRE